MRRRSRFMSLLLLAGGLACETGEIKLVSPDVVSGVDDFTIHVTLEDSALAAALGWEAGVPNATIKMLRYTTSLPPAEYTTDSVGRLSLPNFAGGLWRVWAERILTPDETGPTGGVVRAFGDGIREPLATTGTLPLNMGTDRAGSVVFSEFFPLWYVLPAPSVQYQWAQYFELYNNSDTTVYLDGMLVLQAWPFHNDNERRGCAEQTTFRTDPEGIWFLWATQFPGQGTDYPLTPRSTALVALDALDHSVVHPVLPDLSNADFEIAGTIDADNPAVPNLADVGPAASPGGHGAQLSTLVTPFVLARATDLATLLRGRDLQGTEYWRIPMDRVLDVVTGRHDAGDERYYTLCDGPWVGTGDVDRLELIYPVPIYEPGLSLQRRVLRRTTGGAELLDLNISMVDWEYVARTPGAIQP